MLHEWAQWLRAGSKEQTLRSTVDETFYASNFTYNTDRDLVNQYLSVDDDFSNLKTSDGERRDGRSAGPAALLAQWALLALSVLGLVCTLPFSLFFSVKFCTAFERIVILRLGQYRRTAGPGTVFVLPCVDKVHRVDVRAYSLDLPALHVITADRGIVEARAVVFLQVHDPVRLVCTLQEQDKTVQTVAYTTLYNKLVKSTLADITHARSFERLLEGVNEALREFVKDSGLSVSEVKVLEAKVLKAAENTTMDTFQHILKSDVGRQMLGVLGEHLQEAGGPATLSQQQQLFSNLMSAQSQSTATCPSGAVGQPSAHFPSTSTQPPPLSPSPQLNALLSKLALCLGPALVARVGRRYRLHCDCGPAHGPSTLELDLSKGHGQLSLGCSPAFHPHVTFSLSLDVLGRLFSGDQTPLSAFLGGDVKLEGSVDDAMALKHLAERAQELKLN